MPLSAFSAASRSIARWILVLIVVSPAVCQVATAPSDPTKPYFIANCNPEPKPVLNQDIIGQTGQPPKSQRPLPVRTTTKQGSNDHVFHRDYIVLVYDAERHTTAFYDYDSHANQYSKVPGNGAFLPVLYTKEKFLVRVCNLHPTDTVSIAGNSFTLPEQGADIRGTIPTTAPALAPTLDTLGSASAAGSPFSPAGVNFGSSAPLTSLPISGFTYGSANKDTGYTDAVINVSPEALAFETVSLIRDAQDIVHTIHELNRGDKLNGSMEGSIGSLQEQANRLLTNLNNEPPGAEQRLGWFNQRLVETQQFVTQLNGLANGVSQAGLGPRAVAMRQNFESIFGILKQIHQVDEDDKKIDKSLWTAPPGSSLTGYVCEDIYNNLVRGAITSKQSVPADTFTCRAYERYVMTTFLKRFNQRMNEILTTIATEQPPAVAEQSVRILKKQTGKDDAGTKSKIALDAVANVMVALNKAATRQAHASLLKAAWQKSVLDIQETKEALVQDDNSIAALAAQAKQSKTSADAAESARQLQQQINQADQSPAQVAQVIQQSAKDAEQLADLARDLTKQVASLTAPDNPEFTAEIYIAGKQAEAAEQDKNAAASLAQSAAESVKSQPAPVPPLPRVYKETVRTNPESPRGQNATGAPPDGAAREAAEAARKKFADAQAVLEKAQETRAAHLQALHDAQVKTQSAEKEFNENQNDAARLFNEAVQPAKNAAVAVKEAARALRVIDLESSDQAFSNANQWNAIAEDIFTYASYLDLLHSQTSAAGVQLPPRVRGTTCSAKRLQHLL